VGRKKGSKMKVHVTIDTSNAAFEDYPNELSRLFSVVNQKINEGVTECLLKDINGNVVGWFFTGDYERNSK
jgi:hypothetical protein